MAHVSALSGPVPGGLRVAFVVLTVAAITLAVFAGFRGVWFLTAICGLGTVAPNPMITLLTHYGDDVKRTIKAGTKTK